MLIRKIIQKLISDRELAHLNHGSPGPAWTSTEFRENTCNPSADNWFESAMNIVTNAASVATTLTKPVQTLKEKLGATLRE